MDQFLAGLGEGLITAVIFGAVVLYVWVAARVAARQEARAERAERAQARRDQDSMAAWRETTRQIDRARRPRA